MKYRKMLSLNKLDEARKYREDGHTYTKTIEKLNIEGMNDRVILELIKADELGYHNATRPAWLEWEPDIQVNTKMKLEEGLTVNGYWLELYGKQQTSDEEIDEILRRKQIEEAKTDETDEEI